MIAPTIVMHNFRYFDTLRKPSHLCETAFSVSVDVLPCREVV